MQYIFEKDNLFVDSIVSEDEIKGNTIELKFLIDITNEEIASRFFISLHELNKLRECSLVAFVTINKYKKLINFIKFEIESQNKENININLNSPLSMIEQENFRKMALQELGRNYYRNK